MVRLSIRCRSRHTKSAAENHVSYIVLCVAQEGTTGETPNKGKRKASKQGSSSAKPKITKAQLKEMLDHGGMLHIIETYPKHAEKARAYMNKRVVRLSDVL
jgi:hypothetical protein